MCEKAKAENRHPMQWTAAGLIRLAATSIGRCACSRSGLGESNRTVDALTSVAHICTALQGQQVSRTLAALKASGTPLFVVHRHRDATPVSCYFGQLGQQVCPIARYLAKTADGKWARLTADAFRALAKKAVPSIG